MPSLEWWARFEAALNETRWTCVTVLSSHVHSSLTATQTRGFHAIIGADTTKQHLNPAEDLCGGRGTEGAAQASPQTPHSSSPSSGPDTPTLHPPGPVAKGEQTAGRKQPGHRSLKKPAQPPKVHPILQASTICRDFSVCP